jgi:iron complex transport system permease protein
MRNIRNETRCVQAQIGTKERETKRLRPPPDDTQYPPPRRSAWRFVFAGLAGALVGLCLLSIWLGESGVSEIVTPQMVWRVLGRHIPLLSSSVAPLPENLRFIESIVWEGRFPRALGGALIGMLLAMAGVAFQSFLMNPLADPYMVGVSAGAALGSVLVILAGGMALLGGYAQPLAAFATGLLATLIVYLLASKSGRVSAQTFLLAGIVVGTFLWSLIPLMISLANRSGRFDRQSAILSILLGNLQSLDWTRVGMLAIFGLAGMTTLWLGARELNMLAIGETSAATTGVHVEGFKRRIILAGTLATAAAVSVAGIIAFVGLVVPHIARRLVGADHRLLLPAAMLLGGIVLVGADLLSRVFLAQLEVGVVTSLCGAPVFCYLLRRRITAS